MPRKPEMTANERKKMNAKRRARRAVTIQNVRIAEAASSDSGEDKFVEWYNLVEDETKRQKLLKTAAGKVPPKAITAARENLSDAFDLMGGVAALVVWGRTNPTEFYRLWARLIPKESVEVSAQLPLEELLKKLSGKEGSTVADAAFEIGTEILEQARLDAAAEDALIGPTPEDSIN